MQAGGRAGRQQGWQWGCGSPLMRGPTPPRRAAWPLMQAARGHGTGGGEGGRHAGQHPSEDSGAPAGLSRAHGHPADEPAEHKRHGGIAGAGGHGGDRGRCLCSGGCGVGALALRTLPEGTPCLQPGLALPPVRCDSLRQCMGDCNGCLHWELLLLCECQGAGGRRRAVAHHPHPPPCSSGAGACSGDSGVPRSQLRAGPSPCHAASSRRAGEHVPQVEGRCRVAGSLCAWAQGRPQACLQHMHAAASALPWPLYWLLRALLSWGT